MLKVSLVILPSDQLAQPEGTVNASKLKFYWKASSGRRGLRRFHDWIWGCGDCCILHGLGSQRVAWEEKYQVPSFITLRWLARVSLSSSSSAPVFVTLGCRQLLGSCHFARPQSESVSVFDCLRLRLSPSSSISVFVYPRRVPGGWSRGRRLSVRCSTSTGWKPPWRACFKFVRYSVKCGELVVKRPLLCCDVLS